MMNKLDDDFIELHYFTKKYALKQTRSKLLVIQNKIENHYIAPNHDGKNHIVQISCGVGRNSGEDGPVLNKAVSEMLNKANYQHYCYKVKEGKLRGQLQGIFLVRLEIQQWKYMEM